MSNFRAGQKVVMNSECNKVYPGLRKEGPTRKAKFGVILKTTPGFDKLNQPQCCIVLFEHRGVKSTVELEAPYLENFSEKESNRERAERKAAERKAAEKKQAVNPEDKKVEKDEKKEEVKKEEIKEENDKD